MSNYYTKHAPKTIDECVLPDAIKELFFKIKETGHIPNMLFYGSCGIGKSIVSTLFSDESLILRCDSDDENNDIVSRGRRFATSASLFSDDPKVLVFDEIDCLSIKAQEKVRALVDHAGNCSFIATTNHLQKVLPALRSRLKPVCFDVAANSLTMQSKWIIRLKEIFHLEHGQDIDDRRIDAAMKSFPDARRMITTCLTGIL